VLRARKMKVEKEEIHKGPSKGQMIAQSRQKDLLANKKKEEVRKSRKPGRIRRLIFYEAEPPPSSGR